MPIMNPADYAVGATKDEAAVLVSLLAMLTTCEAYYALFQPQSRKPLELTDARLGILSDLGKIGAARKTGAVQALTTLHVPQSHQAAASPMYPPPGIVPPRFPL